MAQTLSSDKKINHDKFVHSCIKLVQSSSKNDANKK